MNKSFQIIRTNPRLTTNLKLVVDSKYNLYFESFNSSKQLSNDKYKHYLLNREAMLENEIPKFYGKLPKNIAFTPRTQEDEDVMYDQYRQQFDNTYYSGANEVEDQWYEEEFEYFAPLYFRKNDLPKNFIILRVDDPSVYVQNNDDYIFGQLNRENFKQEIIDKWKCVSLFDLTTDTSLGKFFDRNINDNSRFPEYSMFFDTKPYNYSKWSGIDYQTGVYNTAELFLDDKLFYSNGHFDFEEFITTSFEKNNLIYPYILNIKFLFDDKRGTPNEMLPWTMNRYFGFYIEDLEIVKTITSFRLPELKSNLTISNNIFLLDNKFVNPFVLSFNTNQWIQVGNDFYEVKRQENGSFKIISDRNLTGYDVSNFGKGDNMITPSNNKNYISNIENFDIFKDENGVDSDMYADVYLIEVDSMYHILKKDEVGFFIHSDYAITSNNRILQYWKGGMESEFSVLKDSVNENGSPLSFKIYRVKFLDIKDFDFDRINTKYSDFDYEKSEYYETPEVKLYAKEFRDNSTPLRKKTHDRGEDGQFKPMIVSSEYTSCDETFQIRSNKLTPIFEKNQSICKWGYNGSISHSDYPYKINNNFECSGVYNRTVNNDLKISNVKEKTLDYFYRIGSFYSFNDVFMNNDFNPANWSVLTSGWSVTGTKIDFISFTNGIFELEYDIEIEEGILYSVELLFEVTNVPSGTIDISIGTSPDVFRNGIVSSSSSDLLNIFGISLIDISLSNKFKLYVNVSNMQAGGDVSFEFTSIKITKTENVYYLNQSTNIQVESLKKYDLENITNVFNLQQYINSDFDYFDFFFNNNMIYQKNGKLFEKTYRKYSVFGGGDDELPSTTLFKGIEYNLYDIEDIVLNSRVGLEQTIRNVITKGGKEYNGYKFSVILGENYNFYNFDVTESQDGLSFSNPTYLFNNNRSIFGSNALLNSEQDGIHIFLNKKFKNILIIINKNIPFYTNFGSMNYVDNFGENYGLYNGKTLNGYNFLPLPINGVKEYNPDDLTSSNYTKSINELNSKTIYDTFINYYMIDEDGNFAKTEMIRFNDTVGNDRFRDLPNWEKKYPPFFVQTTTYSDINLKPNSYTVTPLRGPETNIYDKYLVYSDRKPLKESFINQPLARKITKNEIDETKIRLFHGEKIKNVNKIFRFVGYYEPIFKNLNIFKPTYYWNDGNSIGSISGNYSFNLQSEQFGIVDELMHSKVNEIDNFLKLKNSDFDRSFFPMLDEVGISQTQRFVFLSPWDRNFYLRTLNEQTFLENYVQTPFTLKEIITSAEIVSSTILSGFDHSIQYSNNMNIYGYGRSPVMFIYRVEIRNLSSVYKNIGFRMNFINNYGSLPPTYIGTTGPIQPNKTVMVDFNAVRPSEVKSGENLTIYTNTDITYECYDLDNNTVLDIKSLNSVNVYNDLVKPLLISPTYELGKDGNHRVYEFNGNMYWFRVVLDDELKKVAYAYSATLFIEKYDSLKLNDFVIISTTSGNKPINNTSPILFTNVRLYNNILNIPYQQTVYTRVRFIVTYTYSIEGITKTETNTFTDTGYKIVGIYQ